MVNSILTCLILQPEVVEKIVGLREGIPRKDAKEVPILLYFHKDTKNCVETMVYPVTRILLLAWLV